MSTVATLTYKRLAALCAVEAGTLHRLAARWVHAGARVLRNGIMSDLAVSKPGCLMGQKDAGVSWEELIMLGSRERIEKGSE